MQGKFSKLKNYFATKEILKTAKIEVFFIFILLCLSAYFFLSPRDYDLQKYYDILNNQKRDEEIGQDKIKMDVQKLSHCQNLSKGESTESCYLKFYEKYTIDNGPAKAFLHLGSMLDADAKILPGCHYITHGIGEGAYKRNKGDLAKSYDFAVSKYFTNVASCGNGYYHGVSIGLTRGAGSDDGLAKILKDFCKNPTHWGGYGEDACNHGLGHAITLHYSHDRTKSLAMCRRLLGDSEKIHGCFGGVMMEYGIILDSTGIDFPYVSGLQELCKEFPQGTFERETCVLEGAGVVRRDTDFPGAIKACLTMESRSDRLACTKLQIIHAVRIFRSQQLKEICPLMQDEESRIECTVIAAKYLGLAVDINAGEKFEQVINDVCHTLNYLSYIHCFGLSFQNVNLFYSYKQYGSLPTWTDFKITFLGDRPNQQQRKSKPQVGM